VVLLFGSLAADEVIRDGSIEGAKNGTITKNKGSSSEKKP
jgi:hypothetical protein